jgi:flagellar hook-associated protein 1 FlgK
MSLLASLLSSSSALSVFDRAVSVSQNNVTNATTPGYASQRLGLEALAIDPSQGLLGGLRAGDLESARNEFAEAAVRRQQESLGSTGQRAATLQSVEGALDLSGASGIPATLSNLFQSFAAWSLTPTSGAPRRAVIDAAARVAESFHAAAAKLGQVSQDTDRQIKQTVAEVNGLARQIRLYNDERRRGNQRDAALDAKIHTALENLSELVNYTATFQPDGSVTVLAGGQTPLVIGDHSYELAAEFAVPGDPPPANAQAPPTALVLDSAGRDVTIQTTGGRLGALLEARNTALASFLGDAYQQGELNRLAQTFADRVNGILTSGNISDGPPAQAGAPLFSYDATDATWAARTLALDPGITPDQLAAIDPGPPYASNGTVLKLAALSNPRDAADKIDGFSFETFFGSLAAGLGRALGDARDRESVDSQLLAQSRGLRDQVSGVSLDQQAVILIQFQRAYQANAKLITVLNDLTETAVNLLR